VGADHRWLAALYGKRLAIAVAEADRRLLVVDNAVAQRSEGATIKLTARVEITDGQLDVVNRDL
jgi:hypothetical protein